MNLNLVPEKIKKEIKIKLLGDIILDCLFIFSVASVALAIVFKVSWMITDETLSNLDPSDSVSSSIRGYEEEIKEINRKTSELSEIQKDFIPWTCLIKKTGEAADGLVVFDLFNIERENGNVLIEGWAESRDDLLAFKDNLKKIEDFSAVSLPIENLLKKEEINFKITAKLKTGDNE